MLRPLLILCWAATIVSADGPSQVNNTSIPINSAGDNAAINHQLEISKLSVPLTNKDAHVPSILSESNADTKSNVSISTLKTPVNEHITDDAEKPSMITPSTTKLPTSIKPTTTSKPTTTIKPTTTPVPTMFTAPTTPAPTTPLPPPKTTKWVLQKNNTVCIIVQIAAQINVSFSDTNNMTIKKAMDIPINGTVTGKCDQIEQYLTFSWKPQNRSAPTSQDSFTLHFSKNETDKHYSLHQLEITLTPEEFPDAKLNNSITLIHNVSLFNTGLSNSYRCIKEQSLDLILEDKNKTVGVLKVSNLQFQAFRNDNTTNFGLAKDCSYDTPDIVPITVGCALAGLVVIVLIAYLVGRRRSQARGYLSM